MEQPSQPDSPAQPAPPAHLHARDRAAGGGAGVASVVPGGPAKTMAPPASAPASAVDNRNGSADTSYSPSRPAPPAAPPGVWADPLLSRGRAVVGSDLSYMVTVNPPNLKPAPEPRAGDTSRGGGAPEGGGRPEGPPTVSLRGVEFHAVTARQTVAHILACLSAGKGGVVITPNLDHLRRCVSDYHFGALVSEADLVVPDGMPLIWASRLAGRPLPQRVAGSDLITSLSIGAGHAGRSVFLLGGAPGTAEGAAKVLVEKSGGSLRIAGTYCPDYGFEHDPAQMAQMIETLRAASPDIVFVGLGSPKQERVIEIIRHNLPQTWWLGVGVSFSFLVGHVQRAPRWMQKLGLEWAHRFVQEPRRLFTRYFVHGLPYASVLFYDSLRRRFGVSSVRALGNSYPRLKPYADRRPRRSPEPGEPAAAHLPPARKGGAVTDALAPRLERAARDEAQTSVRRADAEGQQNAQQVLSRLRRVVLLGGKLRRDQFTEALGRSVLEMPLGDGQALLDHWLGQVDQLAGHAGLGSLPVHVSVNHGGEQPRPRAVGAAACEVGEDSGDYRGTAGVLRDLAIDFDDDDLVLVANAGQMLLDPLAALARALAAKRGDVTIVSHDDGTPSGLMLVRVAALRSVPAVGYHDMKEQHLPKIADKHGMAVKVLNCRRPTALPVRTLGDYISALRLRHAPEAARRGEYDPLDDGLGTHQRKRFCVIEPGADVAADAYLHDSVVLSGGVVEAGANVARSVVTPGGVVPARRDVLDKIVAASGAGWR